jgi:uncharacterized protein
LILYVDTSALVKRYVREPGSDDVVALIDAAEVVGTTVISRVEMAAALARANRMDWLDRESAWQAWNAFLDQWLSFARLQVTATIVDRASTLAWEHGLRGYDAVHCAAAAIWQEVLDAPITLATYDRGLQAAAGRSGLATWPERAES